MRARRVGSSVVNLWRAQIAGDCVFENFAVSKFVVQLNFTQCLHKLENFP